MKRFTFLMVALMAIFAMNSIAAAPPVVNDYNFIAITQAPLGDFQAPLVSASFEAPASSLAVASCDTENYYVIAVNPDTLAGLMSGVEAQYAIASASNIALDMYLNVGTSARMTYMARDQTGAT